ncbi:caspase family protein [Brachyspira sp.]|uniref:caspase family protein n=1 Tax=Brachyspira sp. TaxID=1977261 RepID=UPI003D7EF1A8
MIRKAILISDNGGVDNDISATKEDVKNYRDFLMSDIGGAWENYEIETHRNPDSNIINDLRNYEYDYTITMVSSHGGIEKEKEILYVYLNNIRYDCISFLNKSKRQLIIFDCCRTYIHDVKSKDDILIEHFSIPSYHNILSKKEYNNYIETCGEGIIILYSCEVGQASGLNKLGSYFISSLISAAKDKIRTKDIVTVKEALELSKEYIKKYPTNQIPEIFPIKINRYFPIAVKI